MSIRLAKWGAVESVVSVALPAISLLVLARVLDVSDFGVFSIAFASVFVAMLLVESLFSDTLLVTAQDRRVESAAHGYAIVAAVVMVIGLWIAAPSFSRWYSADITTIMRALLPCILFSGLTSVPSAVLFRNAQFRTLAMRTLLGRLAAVCLGIACAGGGAGVWALVVAQIANSITVWIVIRRSLLKSIVPTFDVRPLKQLFLTIILFNSSNLFALSGRRLFFLFAARGMVLIEVGYADIAFRLFDILTTTFSGFARRLGLPLFLKKGLSTAEIYSNYWTLTNRTAVVAIAAFGGLGLAGGDALALAFGQKWVMAGDAMLWLCLAGAMNSTRYYIYDLLNNRDKVIWTTAISAFGFSILLLAGLFVAGRSASAMATGWLVCSVLSSFVSFSFSSRIDGIWKARGATDLLIVSLAALIGLGVGYWVRTNWPDYGSFLAAATFVAIFLLGARKTAMGCARSAAILVRNG